MCLAGNLCLFFAVLSSSTLIWGVSGHGRLLEPPGRSSLWRTRPEAEKNYNDNELNCGGFQNQWENHGGKCGVCGDPWQGPRENEPPSGKYAKSIVIAREYDVGSQIPVTVHVTADHLGYFEFRICKKRKIHKPVTQKCLNRRLLKVLYDGRWTTRYNTSAVNNKMYDINLKLPRRFKCRHCVLQWKYQTGNSWGCGDEGCCVGCGPVQEQFYACADISIRSSKNNPSTTTEVNPPTFSLTSVLTTDSTTEGSTSTQDGATTAVTNGGTCLATEEWEDIPSVDAWCFVNCKANYRCPEQYCECSSEFIAPEVSNPDSLLGADHVCYSVGEWSLQEGLDNWCQNNCPCTTPDCDWCLESMCVCLDLSDDTD